MRINEIITEIDRISKIESPEATQEEVRDLDKQIKAPKIKFVIRGNYCYCYEYIVEYRNDIKKTREKVLNSIGRIFKETYLKNKKLINQMSFEELKNYEYLEQH